MGSSSHRDGRGARSAPPTCVLVLGAVLALAVPGSAQAHVTVTPGSSRPADLQTYTITVPNELDTPTTEVSVQVPEGIDFLLVEEPPPGWTAKLERTDERVSVIRWQGGSIAPSFYTQFRVIARNPVLEGPIRWPAIQQYADQKVEWIGEPGSETPAAQVELSEDATPVDVVSTHGDDAAASDGGAEAADSEGSDAGDDADGGAQGADAGGAEADEEEDRLPLILSALALAIALASALMAWLARRRTPETTVVTPVPSTDPAPGDTHPED